MEKKSNQTPRKETNEKEESNYEKLRDELFDYRVTIKTYIKNLNTIIISGTIIFALLAFFGYDKIENIERIIITKVDKRLAITDSILSKIDQRTIDSLNILLTEKELELKKTIENFEKTISRNNELELNLLKNLVENKRIESKNVSRHIEPNTDVFDIREFKTDFNINELGYIYLVVRDGFELDESCFINLSLYPKNRNILLQDKYYSIDSKFNKLSFVLNEKFEKYTVYTLEISLFKKEGKSYKEYKRKIDINLK